MPASVSVDCTATVSNAQLLLMSSGRVLVFLPADSVGLCAAENELRADVVRAVWEAGLEVLEIAPGFTFGYQELPDGRTGLSYGVSCQVRVRQMVDK